MENNILASQDLAKMIAQLEIYDLEQSRFSGMPNHPNNQPSFSYALHRRHEEVWPEERTPSAGLMVTTEHTGTHIDAICHQAHNMMLHGGVKVDSTIQTARGFTRYGAETIEPIVTRGVLLDVAGHARVKLLEAGHAISREELETVARDQDISVCEGDVVLVRTGYGALWDNPDKYFAAPGVSAEASRWLAECGVKAVGADNAAWDLPDVVDPNLHITLPGHLILLVESGIYILEHLYLEHLASQRLYEFMFVCLPLKIVGATGSPVRPIAIKAPEGLLRS